MATNYFDELHDIDAIYRIFDGNSLNAMNIYVHIHASAIAHRVAGPSRWATAQKSKTPVRFVCTMLFRKLTASVRKRF